MYIRMQEIVGVCTCPRRNGKRARAFSVVDRDTSAGSPNKNSIEFRGMCNERERGEGGKEKRRVRTEGEERYGMVSRVYRRGE